MKGVGLTTKGPYLFILNNSLYVSLDACISLRGPRQTLDRACEPSTLSKMSRTIAIPHRRSGCPCSSTRLQGPENGEYRLVHEPAQLRTFGLHLRTPTFNSLLVLSPERSNRSLIQMIDDHRCVIVGNPGRYAYTRYGDLAATVRTYQLFQETSESACLPTSRSDTVVSGRTRRKTGAIFGTMGLTSCCPLL